MTDLERKLAETLRDQAGRVTPNLDAAWAEQQRRQRRPRRRATVWVAPLAAVLVVLTSVLVVTRLNTAPAPAPPADRTEALSLAKFTPMAMDSLQVVDGAVALTDFVGQTDMWTAYAFAAFKPGVPGGLYCVAAVPVGQQLAVDTPLYGTTKSPYCVSTDSGPAQGVRAGYIGEFGGPLPSDKAVFFMDPTVRTLQLFAPNGDLTQARSTGKRIVESMVFLADVVPGAEPVRCRVIWGPLSSPLTHPASR
jgi:hypothetical protein